MVRKWQQQEEEGRTINASHEANGKVELRATEAQETLIKHAEVDGRWGNLVMTRRAGTRGFYGSRWGFGRPFLGCRVHASVLKVSHRLSSRCRWIAMRVTMRYSMTKNGIAKVPLHPSDVGMVAGLTVKMKAKQRQRMQGRSPRHDAIVQPIRRNLLPPMLGGGDGN